LSIITFQKEATLWHVEEDRIPLARLAGLAVEIPRDLSAGLVVDRIPLARLAGLAVEIPLARLAGLAVGRIPLARSVALADDATALGCCASRHIERARCLTVQQSRRNKAKRSSQIVEPEK
jgi:hypothetical protein